MRTSLIALASALLLAAIVTLLEARLWPDNTVALLLSSALALFVNGLFNARLASKGKQNARSRNKRSNNNNQRRTTNSHARTPKNEGSGRDNANNKPANRGGNRDGSSGAAAAAPASAAASQSNVDHDAAGRESGSVKWFNRSKGFGFIVRENGDEIFVHQRSIRSNDSNRRPSLRDGEDVSFVVTEHEKGLQAEDVVPKDRDA